MRIINAFSLSINPVIVHDGISIFRANQLAVELFGYDSEEDLRAAGIAAIIAPESESLSTKRIEKLRKRPDENLPDVRLTFIRKGGTLFSAVTHTRTLHWAFLESENDLQELHEQLHTNIIFYSWIGSDVQEVSST